VCRRRLWAPGSLHRGGCGGCDTIRKLAGIAAEGKVYSIDHSEESVRISIRTNRQLMKVGRVEIQHDSISNLPFPDRMFSIWSKRG
jgi:ubiquinone/menaquinone biosynthesis C-methylase UbiE